MGGYRLGALHALRAPLLAVSARHTRRYMTRRMPGTAASATAASSAAGQSEVPKSGDVLTLECTSLAFGGRGVCKLPGGFVVFCDRAVPGETLEARVTSLKGGGASRRQPRFRRYRLANIAQPPRALTSRDAAGAPGRTSRTRTS